jgi:hypothetical protein
MQINFNPKKLKEAREYVNLLKPPVIKEAKKKRGSFFQRIFRKLFK